MKSLSDALIKSFVISSHFNLEKVKKMLAEHPDLLDVPYYWGENDTERPIQAAAHMGNVAIAEFFLAQGVQLDIHTAAMLGLEDTIRSIIDSNPELIHTVGAHSIPLLPHAAYSGNIPLMQLIIDRGETKGLDSALFSAISKGNLDMTQWLLEQGADPVNIKNFDQKTPLEAAQEARHNQIAVLLEEHLAQ